MGDDHDGVSSDCCWQELLFAPRSTQHVRLFACIRAWRCAVLRRKHRFHVATAREWREVHFFERELPLHAAVVTLNHHEQSLSDVPFELMAFISAAFPGCAERFDECRRPPLFYALEQHWWLDKLSWLVGCSLPAILEKDIEGLSLLTHAVTHACPDEMTVWMAVAVARACLDTLEQLLDSRLFDSARCYCERMLRDYFAGVPEFPLARCRELLIQQSQHDSDNVVIAVRGVQAIWCAFADKWGYYGAPIIQRDLPTQLTAPIDSFVQIAVIAKGEPLSYQWFIDGVAIDTATQAALYVSQSIQPHNAGSYHCEVSNRQGSVMSAVMRVEVVNDQFEADPSQKFRIPRALLRTDDAVSRVQASTGALLQHRSTGVRLLLPPYCFHSVDAHGNNVSDSQGLEVAMRTIAADVETPRRLKLRHGEKLMSCVVEILPHTVPAFVRPATLMLPHCMSLLESSNELVVVRVDPATGNYEDLAGAVNGAVESAGRHPSSKSRQVCVEIRTLGVFAVVSRCLPRNLDASHPLEQAKMFFVRPRHITSAAFKSKVQTSLWIARDRPDEIELTRAQIRRHIDTLEYSDACASTNHSSVQRAWAIDTLGVQVRRNNVLCIQIGERERIMYRWDAPAETPAIGSDPTSATAIHASAVLLKALGCHCVAAAVQLQPSELMEAAATPDDLLPPFCAVRIDVAVWKPHSYATNRLNVTELFSKSKAHTSTATTSVLLSESQWQVLIPVANDAPRVPPMPSLALRSLSQVVLEFDVSKLSAGSLTSGTRAGSHKQDSKASRTSLTDAAARGLERAASPAGDTANNDGGDATVNRFAERHEGEREFTPYFYVVEIAVFSETFWQRYDQTWWFDKTKTAIIDGMYKVVHAGVEPFATVATDAFAGCVRVAQCSVDRFGGYSEPMLLEPLVVTPAVKTEDATMDSGGSGGKSAGSGLVRKLRAIQSSSPRASRSGAGRVSSALRDCSAAVHASQSRLQQLLATLYASEVCEHVDALFGFANSGVEGVAVSLEALRTTYRAANLEIALLLVVLQGLDAHARRVHMHRRWAARWVAKLRLIERLVPVLDCFPVEFFSKVTTELHALALRCFRVLLELSGPGWLGHFLLGEWFESELRSILERVVELLTRKSGGASLRGAGEIAHDLAVFLAVQMNELCGGDLDRIAADCMQRTFALQLLGQYESLQLQDAKFMIAQQLVRALELTPSSSVTNDDIATIRSGDAATAEPVGAETHAVEALIVELEAPSTREALAKLRSEDSLEQHVRAIAPANGEKCLCVPRYIAIHLDPLVTAVDTTQVVRVTNATLGSAIVHGDVEFSTSDGLLTFTPTVAFERKTTYAIKVRCDAVETCLGAALRGVLRFRFATA